MQGCKSVAGGLDRALVRDVEAPATGLAVDGIPVMPGETAIRAFEKHLVLPRQLVADLHEGIFAGRRCWLFRRAVMALQQAMKRPPVTRYGPLGQCRVGSSHVFARVRRRDWTDSWGP